MKKSLFIIGLLISLASCSIFRKSVNQVKQEDHKSSLLIKDSLTHVTIDSSGGSSLFRLGTITFDSAYDKVTEEVVKEVIDSNITRRETTRTIKERGKKRIEQTSATIRNDTASKRVDQNTAVNEVQKQDSSSASTTTQKNIERASFMPWWLWVIIVAAIALGWWKRNPIIDFLTRK